MTTSELLNALEVKYSPSEWAFFPEFCKSEGSTTQGRRTDAIAFNTWPSRGLEVHGFELKASRGDWLRELKDPAKTEENVYKYCDRWWIVVGDKTIVQPGELPGTWGLMIPWGKRLRIKVAAPKLKPRPFDRLFIGSLMRRVYDDRYMPSAIQAKIDEAREEGRRWVQDEAKYDLKIAQDSAESSRKALEDTQKELREFEIAAGCSFSGYLGGNGKKLGEQVRLLLNADRLARRVVHLERMKGTLVELASTLHDAIEKLDVLKEAP